ncbi:hypothetical protein NKJ90_02990 [Mesorhizobium sp. M0051]|uniref:hypothetical protein n=1 Tax=unclassified Mesorhizobium TaxID=325217 RepID=UPI0012EB815F|nr:hypothetical protein [Mesorhizobium sp. LNHC252B00]
MKNRTNLLAAVAALALLASPVFAGPGGSGNGGGHGSGNGNGGNSAGAGSQGHGAATSAAARDPSTSGLTKALSVVATTPASPQATLSLQAALDKLLAKNATEDPADTTDDSSDETTGSTE